MAQQIKPAYATFEQAKWLKEKGLNDHFYRRQGEDSTRRVSCKYCYDPLDESKTLQLWSDNIESSTKERLERLISAPEHWQVVEWLRINHGIWVEIKPECYGDHWYANLNICSREAWDNLYKRNEVLSAFREFNNEHPTPQEAYSAAFDYILNNLI